MVCAAFQSTYILDPEQQRNRFSFFDGDSLILTASSGNYKKDIYGITDRKYGYWKQQELLVVKQKNVYSSAVDSLLNSNSKGVPEQAESGVDSVLTSPALDSVQLASGADRWNNTKRFNYNVDFVNYMLLVGNDILLAQSAARDSAEARVSRGEPMKPTESSSKVSKGVFFKNLFSKKSKESKEPTIEAEVKNSVTNESPDPESNQPLQEKDDDF